MLGNKYHFGGNKWRVLGGLEVIFGVRFIQIRGLGAYFGHGREFLRPRQGTKIL